MANIWRMPLGKRFWFFAFAIIMVGLVLAVFYPLFRVTINWSSHLSVSYRGVTIGLPFGWVYSGGDLPLTVKKPWPSSLTGLESRLLIQETDVTDAQRDVLIDGWKKLHPRSELWTEIDVSRAIPSNDSGLSLRCSRQNVGRSSVVRLECLAGDASWTFRFLGRAADMGQAEDIMRNVLIPPAKS